MTDAFVLVWNELPSDTMTALLDTAADVTRAFAEIPEATRLAIVENLE